MWPPHTRVARRPKSPIIVWIIPYHKLITTGQGLRLAHGSAHSKPFDQGGTRLPVGALCSM